MHQDPHCLPDVYGRSFGDVQRCPLCGGTFYLWFDSTGVARWYYAKYWRRVWFYIIGKTRI